MSRLIDPRICPDCRAPLSPDAVCTGCGLRLSGPLAMQLWGAMQAADRLVEQLRAASPAGSGVGQAEGPGAFPSTPSAGAPVPQRRRLLPAMSVPVVLLTVGALCLLVFAVLFVAASWSVLGITGRTLVLLAITGAFAGLSVVLTRRGLRGGAEATWTLTGGMLVVDLLGARSADLAGLGSLGWRDTTSLVGAGLLVPGTVVALEALRQPVQRLLAPQLLAVLGALLVTFSQGWAGRDAAVGTSLVLPVLVLLAWGLRRRLPLVATAIAGLAGVSWGALLLIGWSRTAVDTPDAAWWAGVDGWPLAVTAAYAALATVPRALAPAVRATAAGGALLALALLANGPVNGAQPTRDLAIACLTVLVLAAITALPALGHGRTREPAQSLAWAQGAGFLATLGAGGLLLRLLVAPWQAGDRLPDDGLSPLDLTVRVPTDAAAWTVGLAVLAVLGVVAALPVLLASRTWARATAGAIAAGVVGLGTLDLVLALRPPLVVAVAAALLAALGSGGAAWLLRRHVPAALVASGAAGHAAAITLSLAAAATLLSAVSATVLVLALAAAMAGRDREGAPRSAAVLAVLAALGGGFAAHQWAIQLEATPYVHALTLAVYAGAVGVLAAPGTWSALTRMALEGSVLPLTVAAIVVDPADATTAMVLTLVGAAVCLVSILQADRVQAGWLGAFVLLVATSFRVDAGVRAPELYALPAALVLVVVGAGRLRRDPSMSSVTALGSGITLALLPSLLLALGDPVSLRGGLIAAGGVLVLAWGVVGHLSTPLLLGGGTTALLALRHLEPIADAVPRWVSLGLVGAVLLAVGITWEARLANLGTARRYLAGLR